MIYYSTAFLWLFIAALCSMFSGWVDDISPAMRLQAEAGGIFTWLWVWVRLVPAYIMKLFCFLFLITSPFTYFWVCKEARRQQAR